MSKTYWNYRVFKSRLPIESIYNFEDEYKYQIYEVYYEDNCIQSYTKEFAEPYGETEEELKEDLKMMLKAFDKPTLEIPMINSKDRYKEYLNKLDALMELNPESSSPEGECLTVLALEIQEYERNQGW